MVNIASSFWVIFPISDSSALTHKDTPSPWLVSHHLKCIQGPKGTSFWSSWSCDKRWGPPYTCCWAMQGVMIQWVWRLWPWPRFLTWLPLSLSENENTIFSLTVCSMFYILLLCSLHVYEGLHQTCYLVKCVREPGSESQHIPLKKWWKFMLSLCRLTQTILQSAIIWFFQLVMIARGDGRKIFIHIQLLELSGNWE